jgi:hypothetical protein
LAEISWTVLSPRSASSATAALNLSEKFRRFVILVSIHSCWIHLSTLSEFAGPLQADPPIMHLSGKRAVAAFQGCAKGQIIVSSVTEPDLGDHECKVFDPSSLKETGAIAMDKSGDGWKITTARDVAGMRLWTHWPAQKRKTNGLKSN